MSAETNRPVIRISSIQQPPERIVIDTNLPTIVPPPTLGAEAAPDEPLPHVQSASISPHAMATGVEKKKSKAKKKQVNQVASKHPPPAPAILVASSSPALPPTRLSFANIISGQLVRELFNLH